MGRSWHNGGRPRDQCTAFDTIGLHDLGSRISAALGEFGKSHLTAASHRVIEEVFPVLSQKREQFAE
jgi:hypothetical protein